MSQVIKAAQAWDAATRAMESVDIDEEMDHIMELIKIVSDGGGLATATQKTMNFTKAEKLVIELEELGYTASAHAANMKINNENQAYVAVNWKTLPANTRERHN